MLAKVAQWRRGTGSYEHFFPISVIIGNVPLFLPAGYFCCNFINHNWRVGKGGKGVKGGSGSQIFVTMKIRKTYLVVFIQDLIWNGIGKNPTSLT